MAPPQPHPSHQSSKRKLSSKADLWRPWFATRQVQLKCRRLRRCELVPLARMLQHPVAILPRLPAGCHPAVLRIGTLAAFGALWVRTLSMGIPHHERQSPAPSRRGSVL
jgi:hypothetical protein